MNQESRAILNLFPEPIIIVTTTGIVKIANQSAYRLFPLLSQKDDVLLCELIETDHVNIEKWLRGWVRSPSMMPGSITLTKQDGSINKLNLEAGGIHGINSSPLVMLRFPKDNSMIQKFLDLSERVTNLHQEIAKQKRVEEKLRLSYQQLMSKNQTLKSLVFQESLTGLANRRLFDETLSKYWVEAATEKWSLGLILIDIDHFKLYNDNYGHPQGDICLKAVAQAIGSQIRGDGDLAARYGGEEFAIILRKAEIEGVLSVINRVFAAIKALAIPHQNSLTSRIVTISAGISTLIPLTSNNESVILIQKADQALYQAKKQGRNRYIIRA